MKVTCLALEPGGAMRPEAETSAIEGWHAGEGPYWVHLGDCQPEAVAAWLTGLGLDAVVLEVLEADEGETRILPLEGALFIAYAIPGSEGPTKPARFGILCLERLVVTMHEAPDGSSLDDAIHERIKLPEGTTAGVVCALSVVQSSRLRHHLVKLRREADVLADRMDSDPRSVSLVEILAVKHCVLALGAAVDEYLAVLEILRVSNRPVLPLHHLVDAFQVAIEITRATDRDIDRLDRRASDLQGRYESAQQDLVNRRLGLLTALSTIFLPLTLLAGIYGMNFEVMPELHYRYGYPLTLAAMALIAGGLFWIVRSRWWPR